MQDDTKQTEEVMAKRNAKNSVFLDRFQNKSYLLKLFDDEQIMKSFIRSERYEAAQENARETAKKLIKKGKMTLDEIADCVPLLSLDELKELEAEVMQSA